ncbi:pectin acetylesterase 8-like isoform X2 [Salvia splendens]|uniref:pectin acetylesterase 8-like isoform X2 n=1 Tax=Salvia splendens TaxID=180675 RepID=UPI001C27B0BB|nr:pectin acetylesterase 8-like isoform X2 [Salvia splendens]
MARLLLALVFSLVSIGIIDVSAHNVQITILESAIAKGAVCLDGTPPGYAYSRGYGAGVDNWHIYLQGGEWCVNVDDCLERTRTPIGTGPTPGNMSFGGMLEDNSTFNPDFYNWNTVHIFYCDGSSFFSNVDEVDPALLSGGSAGGLATILHCDKFKTLFPNTTRVKCLSDSGFFIHGEHFVGADWRENRFSDVISTHGLTNLLPPSCTSKFNPTLCFFPENLVQDVKTPLFLIESAFDLFQITQNVFRYITPRWYDCTHNLMLCNSTEITIIKDFRNTFLNTITNTFADSSSRIGYFVHTCYAHGHLCSQDYSTCSSSAGHNVLNNKTITQAVSDWFFDRSEFKQMDICNDMPRNCTVTDWNSFLQTCAAWNAIN